MASTDTGPLLHFEPHELTFVVSTVELNAQLSSSLRLFNRTDNHVCFKLLTTKPKKYGVRPRIGLLPPGSDCEITVTTRISREAADYVRCKDKFLIRTAVAGPGATVWDAQNMFNREAGDVFHECMLRVVYVTPESTFLAQVADEITDSPSRASTSQIADDSLPEVLRSDRFTAESANPSLPESMQVMSSNTSRNETILSESMQVMSSNTSTNETNLSEVMSPDISTEIEIPHPEVVSTDNEPATDAIQRVGIGKLLHVQPLELQCPLKLKKENQCSLQLSNLTENHVAFLVKSASSKYFAHPNVGIILPRSTCEIAVKNQEEISAQSDTQCEEKFLIHSFVAIPAAVEENITPEMFNRGGSTIEECDVQVVHIIPLDNIADPQAEFLVMGVIVCLLAIVSWYLMKQTVFLIWTLTIVIVKLIMKMANRLVSESVEDLVIKALLYVFMHLGQRIYFRWSRLRTVAGLQRS